MSANIPTQNIFLKHWLCVPWRTTTKAYLNIHSSGNFNAETHQQNILQYINKKKKKQSDEHTQFSTKEAHSVVATEAMSLVPVEADKAIVLVILMNNISCLVVRDAIVGFNLSRRKVKE